DVGLVQRHREQLEVPRIAEMRGDDLEVREGGCGRVEPDRSGEVDSDPLATRLAGTDPACPGVKQNDQAEVLALLVQRPVPFLVWCECLRGRMQLHAFQAELGGAIDLLDGAVALQRVDAAESRSE